MAEERNGTSTIGMDGPNRALTDLLTTHILFARFLCGVESLMMRSEGLSDAVKFTVLTAAIGTGFVAEAGAANISTVPVGFTPQVFTTATDTSYGIDLDANGTVDFTIASSSANNNITLSMSTTSGADSLFSQLKGYSNTSNFSVTNVKYTPPVNFVTVDQTSSPPTFNTAITPGTFYANVGADLTFGPPSPPFGNLYGVAGANGYLYGNLSEAGSVATFTLLDFGLVAVPEPTSLALLATGAFGIAAFRRRRAATPA